MCLCRFALQMKTDKAVKAVSNTVKVGIFETEAYGAKAYHAKCLECDWETRKFDHQETALAWAKRHVRHIKPNARLAKQIKYAEAMGAINRAANEENDETPFNETPNAQNYRKQ